MREFIVSLYQYHHFSIIKLINHLDELPQEIFSKGIKSGFSSNSLTLNHIYSIELFWIDRICNETSVFTGYLFYKRDNGLHRKECTS